MSSDGENFLSRWSRRKTEARGGEGETTPGGRAEAPGPPVVPSPNADRQPDVASLPPVEELRGLESEYREFLRSDVDEPLRRSALKKLFHDPHFNQMDGLDTYIDDYTKPDPIPEAMLKALNQAQGLVFDREEKQEQGEQRTAPSAESGTPQPEALPSTEDDAARDGDSVQPESPGPSESRPS